MISENGKIEIRRDTLSISKLEEYQPILEGGGKKKKKIILILKYREISADGTEKEELKNR